MKRMSFSATIEPMRQRLKTVTRRAEPTWKNTQAGDEVLAIEKAMGLPAGAKQVPIYVIRFTGNTLEQLGDLTDEEVAREGFPGRDVDWFLANIWQPMHRGPLDLDTVVRRLPFFEVPE